MTILEVMIAVLVLSFGILTAGAMYSGSALLRSRSGGYSRAAAIATRKLEQIRRLPAAQITADTLRSQGMADAATTTTTTTKGGTTAGGITPSTSPTSGSGSSGSSGSLTFTSVDNVPGDLSLGTGTIQLSGVGTDLVGITITLNWTGMRGKAESLTTTTYVADRTAWRG